MTRIAYLSLAALAAGMAATPVFAKPDATSGGKSPAPAPVPTPVPAGSPSPVPTPALAVDNGGSGVATETKDAPFTSVVSDIPMPEKRPNLGNRGGRSIYPFDTMEPGQSFGVVGKTLKNIASTVASANKRFAKPDKLVADNNPDGTPKMVEATVNGVKQLVPAKRPERKFVAMAVDAATDPQGASVRVWRQL